MLGLTEDFCLIFENVKVISKTYFTRLQTVAFAVCLQLVMNALKRMIFLTSLNCSLWPTFLDECVILAKRMSSINVPF